MVGSLWKPSCCGELIDGFRCNFKTLSRVNPRCPDSFVEFGGAIGYQQKIMLLLALQIRRTLLLAAIWGLLFLPQVGAQKSPVQENELTTVGGVTLEAILKRLGARLEHGVSAAQLSNYARHFSGIDRDADGRHSKAEYIENGNYLTPQARRGIFSAADSDQDGFVAKAEYILNRIITDEAKAIVQAMDDDRDGLVQRLEFVKHAKAKLSDEKLSGAVFAALDTDGNGALRVSEYLRVWGQWARTGRKSPAQRLSKASGDPGAAKEQPGRTRPGGARGREGGGPPSGRPGGGFGPFSGNSDPVRLNQAGLKIGSSLPEVTIVDAEGKKFETASLKGSYSVLVFGCLT